MSIDLNAARSILDFGARMGQGQLAEDQLEGAVAIHNLLANRGVAYLADEVGMGKTYVALGAIALFRHFHPGFRVLLLAPRRNIQLKWMKEQGNFIQNNIRYPELRNRSLDGKPVWPMVMCESLMDLVHASTLDPNRDFYCRLSSFSMAVDGDQTVEAQTVAKLKKEVLRHLPWAPSTSFSPRGKQAFKDDMARLLCCALPRFDLVVVDEAHNLKHGFSENASARNRVLSFAMGARPLEHAQEQLFRGYGLRAPRVLFLSATPVEDSYRQLWNQLDVFGHGDSYQLLADETATEADKKCVAEQFLIRRVTSLRIGEKELTRNLYRREWRGGGVEQHDRPVRVEGDRQRLVLALVQKKVSELLGDTRFGRSFQVGMLASFESFHETTSRILKQEVESGNFDGTEQTLDAREREGIDVQSVNALARSYRAKFGTDLPHPKMDAVADSLVSCWRTGEKALVFVRRVASVHELKNRLDDAYDRWLIGRLRQELPEPVRNRFEKLVAQYDALKDRGRTGVQDFDAVDATRDAKHLSQDVLNRGGQDTFFAWYFRGNGPEGVLSGANVQQRFLERSTFFADNTTAWILGCRPDHVIERMCASLGMDREQLRVQVAKLAIPYLPVVQKPKRTDFFEAAHAAACELLKGSGGVEGERATVVSEELWWQTHGGNERNHSYDPLPFLEEHTFLAELEQRPALCARLWPEARGGTLNARLRERFLRAQLLASAMRLGHSLIDFYCLVVRSMETLEGGQLEEESAAASVRTRAVQLADWLEIQQGVPISQRKWNAFDELSELASHFELIVDVNVPDVRSGRLSEASKAFGVLLGRQQPVAGMEGKINQTVIRQFRMPGYPFVLVSTDLLQEGEDLHTFCSRVHHYGISWTPSAMEQRTGRIDRVRSQTDRRLRSLIDLSGDAKLQVHYPYLQGTIEVLQVRRVLERMNTFVRLMHEGLAPEAREARTVDVDREMHATDAVVPQITEVLRTAFPVRKEWLKGERVQPAVTMENADRMGERFARIPSYELKGLQVEWAATTNARALFGTAQVDSRIQPFSLMLASTAGWLMVRCVSPVGRVGLDESYNRITASLARFPAKVGAIITREDRSYDMTVEGEVLLGPDEEHDEARIRLLISRVVRRADELEQRHVPNADAPLSQFERDLKVETENAR